MIFKWFPCVGPLRWSRFGVGYSGSFWMSVGFVRRSFSGGTHSAGGDSVAPDGSPPVMSV